ncbi:hypothetical protein GGR27_001305 [Lewinella antarctica]|uniref:RloB n=1 Tax=Neolewinella antarctica TaxID=442734 RepID=A0ABX0X9Z8_9BACT|nr:hypothetical protein [Neolewinella antarctica]
MIEKAIANTRGKNYSAVWVVIDLDLNPAMAEAEQYRQLTEDLAYAERNKINVAYSADAFELWFRLHYENVTGFLGREQLYEDLSQRWTVNYDPDGKAQAFAQSIPQLISEDDAANQENAIACAKNQHQAVQHLPLSEQGAVTTVYQLVAALLESAR